METEMEMSSHNLLYIVTDRCNDSVVSIADQLDLQVTVIAGAQLTE